LVKDLKQEHKSPVLFDKKAIDNKKWFDILTTRQYTVIEDYFKTRKKVLLSENEQLSEDLIEDNLRKIGANLARLNEINSFLKKVNFKIQELVGNKGEVKNEQRK